MRNANIGIGVSFVILAVTVIFFRDAGEGALQIIGLAAFFSAFLVYHVLDERERRREHDR